MLANLAHHPPVEAASTSALPELLARVGVELAPPAQPSPAHAQAPTILAYDGRLKPELGTLLRQSSSAFFLSCPGDARVPQAADLMVLSKLLRRSTLLPDFEGVQRYYVGSLDSLRSISERVMVHLESAGAPASAAQAAADVMYELAANALLDAPAGEDGKPRYAHRRDEPGLRIAAEDAAVITFGIQGKKAVLGAFDRFGRLTHEPLSRTLEGIGGRAKVNDSGGGAGLGLRRIVEQSELVAARVIPGRATEVLCTVDLGESRRRAANPKSIFFSVERG
jgi:hypothetical protein